MRCMGLFKFFIGVDDKDPVKSYQPTGLFAQLMRCMGLFKFFIGVDNKDPVVTFE